MGKPDIEQQSILYQNMIRVGILFLSTCLLYLEVINKLVKDLYDDPNYSHGFIIPFVSGYLLWQKRESLKKIKISPHYMGIVVLAGGLILFVFANLGAELFTMRVSMLIVWAGIIISIFGATFFKSVSLAYAYLYFMIPLPYILYDSIAFPLKLLVAKYSVLSLQAISIPIYREGNIIMLPDTVLEVADACSGLRSLISLLALGVACAYFFQKTTVKRIVLVLSAVPIAVFSNGIRVIGTGFLAHYYGSGVAKGFFHEFAGLVIFAISMVLLIFTSAALNCFWAKPRPKD